MTIATYLYFAPIANAHGSFRSISLPAPFKVERWDHGKIVKLWRQLAWIRKFETELHVENLHVVPRGYETGHVVTGKIEAKIFLEAPRSVKATELFYGKEQVLRDRLRLVGLCLCGQPTLAASYWYTIEEGKPELAYGGMAQESIRRFPVTPNQNSIRSINDFASGHSLPLIPDYLQTALEHWEEAMRAQQTHIEFFSLMVALETLFNVGAQDVRYRVSRSVAVLLGRNLESADYIFESVKQAYDVRSKLVHTGRPKGLEKVWMWHLRTIVQEAIVKMLQLGLPKEKISEQLTRLGFGQPL